jgi:hypothetical protein
MKARRFLGLVVMGLSATANASGSVRARRWYPGIFPGSRTDRKRDAPICQPNNFKGWQVGWKIIDQDGMA